MEKSCLTPLLEQTHPLTLAIGTPEVATAAGAVTTVLRPVVAVAAASYASSLLLRRPHQILQSIVCIIRVAASLKTLVFLIEVRTGKAPVGQDDRQKAQPQQAEPHGLYVCARFVSADSQIRRDRDYAREE